MVSWEESFCCWSCVSYAVVIHRENGYMSTGAEQSIVDINILTASQDDISSRDSNNTTETL